MKTLSQSNLGSSRLVAKYGRTMANAIASNDLPAKRDNWRELVDQLLEWRLAAPGDPDAPTLGNLDTAIDLARSLREQDQPCPTTAAWSGDGRLIFEWRDRETTQAIEILDVGLAEITRFRNGKVVSTESLLLPSRKLG